MATSSSIHSNAFNFLSFVESGVDPRTGQYTCSLSLPELNGNDLAGPQLPLRLAYSPLNTLDSGFGKGWNLQLSQYDTGTRILSLSSGDSYLVTSTSSDGNELLMREKKLDTFHLHDLGGDRFQVVHKSGLVEELAVIGADGLAVPVLLQSPSGHHLSLDYDLFTRHALLKSVANADGSLLLDLTRTSARVEVRLHPGSSAESLFSLVFSGSENRVSRIELPTDNLAGWRFDYEVQEGLLCINRVEGPLGGSEQIFYNGGAHAFPGLDNRRLPRVARHLHDPGAGQPLVDTRYEYSANNFLGRNAPGLSWEDNGLDNLYKVRSEYTYFSIERLWDTDSDKARRTITRTFNRFHLSIEERTEQGDCVQRVETEYHLLAGEVFEDQPEKCQLPKTVTHAWHRTSESGKERKDVRHTDYDRHGNEILRIEANGVSEASEYYPVGGSDGCPADPQGFVRHLKEKIVTPAPVEFGDAPVLRHAYRYASLPPVSGASTPWVALVEETLFQVSGNVELQKLRTHYAIQPANSFQHGRKTKSEVFLGGLGTFSDFFYTRPQGRRAAEPVLRTAEILSTSFDATTKTIIRESSLINGEPLLDLDDNDVEVAYVYDLLGRVIEETVAPGSDYQATRSYEYILVAETGGSASQTVTDVKQVRTRSHVDGLQRVVREERQEPGAAFRDIYLARHSAFGHRVESTEIDWLDEKDHPLVSQYGYDDWDLQASLTGADGVTTHTLNDPVAREVQTWRDGEGRTITRSNPFDKPDSVERLDLKGKSYSQHLYFYDGLGRTHHDLDQMQNFRFYQYDAFDRMTLSGLPDGTEVERRYAGHSRKELPVWIGVNGKVIGEQGFDGLGRRLWLASGSARDEYCYEGSQSRPDEHFTPAGDCITYTYTPQLTPEPVAQVAEDEASYCYDALDARLRAAQNSRGRREFDYDAANHPSVERWVDGDTTWTASYSYSRLGRQWRHEDINGLETRSEYDLAGRLEHVSQGRIEVDYCYDSLSRPYLTHCRDLDGGSELVTTLLFDDWGREVSRTLALTGQPTRTITQTYRQDDRLSSRHQQSAGQTLLLETFTYDERGRLTHHTCSGTQLPVDRYGNAIVEQGFDFDALDNLYGVYTRFDDGSEDTCTRTFAIDDPCQLVKLVHTHADYPASLDLDYDANGNLLVDEQGRALAYDRQNRLLQVKDTDGQVLVNYHYDAHSQLCGEDRGSTTHDLRFYQGDRLDCTVQGSTRISFLHDEARPLAQQQLDTADNTLLLLTGASNTVLGEGQRQTLRQSSYSAFGERDDANLHCTLGFNGEIRDRQTGWYLLGKGYRVYNPYLMCFHSRDSSAPFEAGGINRYMYCSGDPVNFRDPTGHFLDFLPSWMTPVLKWGGLALGIVGMVASFGALTAPGLGLVAGFMKAGAVAKLSAVASATSVGSGVGALMVSDQQTSKVLGAVSLVTGIVSAVTGLKAFGSALKNKPLGQVADDVDDVVDNIPNVANRINLNPALPALDDVAPPASQASGTVASSPSLPAAPVAPRPPSTLRNGNPSSVRESQAITVSRQSGAAPEQTASTVRSPAKGHRASI